MELIYWPRLVLEKTDRDQGAGPDHPMRGVVEQVATNEDGWNHERATKVRTLFDEMAPEWKLRSGTARTEALIEALRRLAPNGSCCLEVGCGTGFVLGYLDETFETTIGIDLSFEMLANSNCPEVPTLQADAAKLPFASATFDLVVIVNSLLFTNELKRVLDDDGALIWVSTNGDRTPIYLSPERVHQALGDDYYGVSAGCGDGIWSCFSRKKFWPDSG